MRVWWNGRHGGLKILWWLHRAGSSPATRTIRGIRKIKNVERRATEPVRWPPIDWGVGGSRQMRISCNPLLLFIWADAGTGSPFCLPFKCRIILIGKEPVLKTGDGESHCRFESCVRRHCGHTPIFVFIQITTQQSKNITSSIKGERFKSSILGMNMEVLGRRAVTTRKDE